MKTKQLTITAALLLLSGALTLVASLGNAFTYQAYGNAVTLNNAANQFTGTFIGNGAALTSVSATASQQRPISLNAPSVGDALAWDGANWRVARRPSAICKAASLQLCSHHDTVNAESWRPSAIGWLPVGKNG